MWSFIATSLSAQCRLILPDLRGFGNTPWQGSDFTLDEMADDVVFLLDTLGLKTAILGGLSMGGYVTLSLMDRYPHRCQAVVLMDTHPRSDTDQVRKNRERTAHIALHRGLAPLMEEMVPSQLCRETLNAQPDLVAFVKRLFSDTSPQAFAQAQKAMGGRPDRSQSLQRFDRPSLILVGEQDVLTPPAVAQEMASQLRGSSLHLVERAGHLPPLENPISVINALLPFIRSLESDPKG
jgi:pimeloyl-ACP methyl ester carboxylesterase